MRITVIMKDLSEAFYKGHEGAFVGFDSLNADDKFRKLNKDPQRFPMKIGSGQFRDKVELNQLMRDPHTISYQLLSRKGYKLAEFIVCKLL